MGLFGFGKRDKVLDLTENYKRKMEKAEQTRQSQKNSPVSAGAGPFSFFDSPAEATGSSESSEDLSETADERRKRLAKRILEMTEKVEDLGNQIYHLQQRLEVLERKNDVKRF